MPLLPATSFETPGAEENRNRMFSNLNLLWLRTLQEHFPSGFPNDLTGCQIHDIQDGNNYLGEEAIFQRIANVDGMPGVSMADLMNYTEGGEDYRKVLDEALAIMRRELAYREVRFTVQPGLLKKGGFCTGWNTTYETKPASPGELGIEVACLAIG